MKIHELKPAEGSVAKSKRLGRGTGSGLGKTSGKGHKGQNATQHFLPYPPHSRPHSKRLEVASQGIM